MANIFEFEGFRPVIDESSFIHPNATVTGNVFIGKNVYVGPGAAIRGDWGKIVIDDGCNIQPASTLGQHKEQITTYIQQTNKHEAGADAHEKAPTAPEDHPHP